MRVTLLTERQAAREAIRLVNHSKEVAIAVAWATQNEVLDVLLTSGKISRAVVGTHMYITHPAVLRRFAELAGARVVLPDEPRLFHPKVYLFTNGGTSSAIIGSHNLTARAFNAGNVEASVLIEGPSDESVFRDLDGFVRSTWSTADIIDEDTFLFAYEKQYLAKRPFHDALKSFHRVKRPLASSAGPSPMDISWKEFVERVRNDEQHTLDGRLAVLERAQRLFGERESFASMTRMERKAIAGTYGRVESGLDDISWGWFGTMFGQGDFKNLVNESPAGLSASLDCIPPSGEVSEEHFDAFVEVFNRAFKDKAHKGGYPVASRLLAMKRPDQFVAVNSQNRRGIAAACGVAHTTLNLGNFWERIIVPIRLSPWWLQPRPNKGVPARVWDCRAALLDSIYYEGS